MPEDRTQRLTRENAELRERIGGDDQAKREIALLRENRDLRELAESQPVTIAQLRKMSPEEIARLPQEKVSAALRGGA